jgi:alpha-1,2-mannosyltransferase
MAVSEPVAYAIFASYFGLIFTSLGFVLRSLLKDVPPLKLLEAKPFLFLRIAVGALACTWWCECFCTSECTRCDVADGSHV